jgi:hypothetical protein
MSKTRLILIILLIFSSNIAFALQHDEKLWLALNLQSELSQDKKVLGFVFTQLRTINRSHPVQAGLIEGALGYRIIGNDTIWIGYRWTGIDPYNRFFQENRLFQQHLAIFKPHPLYQFILRTRLEEIQRTNQSQIYIRGRERLALEIRKKCLFDDLFPFFSDEVFVNVNRVNYVANQFFDENRLFIGFNLYTGHRSWWEIGYINEYEIRAPNQTQNQMSHILSVTYNLV